jgi:hypothetical protein
MVSNLKMCSEHAFVLCYHRSLRAISTPASAVIFVFCKFKHLFPLCRLTYVARKCSHHIVNGLQMYQKAKMIAMIELDMSLEERREVIIEAYCSLSSAFRYMFFRCSSFHLFCCRKSFGLKSNR